MAEEISGWLQDIDPMEVQNRIIETNPKSQTVRSYSLCQKDNKSSMQLIYLDKENNFATKKKIQRKQNSTIEELKKVMEFLSINEQYKYETHRIFDPNDNQFQPKKEETKKNKFKLHLDVRDNFSSIPYQPLPKSKRQLQPLTDCCLQQKVNSERFEKASIRSTEIVDSQNQTITKFKFPKFIIQQAKPQKTDEEPKKKYQAHINNINRIFSKQELQGNGLTPKPISQKRTNFLQQQLMSNSYDHFFKKAIVNIQEAKERQKQLKSLQAVLKFKQIK